MSEILKFKTNIKCSACVEKVSEPLNAQTEIEKWEVDTTNNDKILTIWSNGITSDKIINLLNEINYKAEPIAD